MNKAKKLFNTVLKYIKESIFYTIYIEGLFLWIMWFFLFLMFLWDGMRESIFLVFWSVILLFIWLWKSIKNPLKSIFIFFGIWLYIMYWNNRDTLFVIPNFNISVTILISIFLMPLLWYYLPIIWNKYWKNTVKTMWEIFVFIFPISIVWLMIVGFYIEHIR